MFLLNVVMLGELGTDLGTETKNRKTRNVGHCKFLKYFLFSFRIYHIIHTLENNSATRRFFKEISMCVCTKCASLNILFIFANDTLCLSHWNNKKILVKTIVDLRVSLPHLPPTPSFFEDF